MKPEEPEKKKQVYQKPVLRTIELKAEEVLAAGCKKQNLPPRAPGAFNTCWGVFCAKIGS